MAQQDTSLDDIAEAIVSLATTMDEGFTGLNMRMDGLDHRMDRLESRMYGLESRMDSIENHMSKFERDTNEQFDKIDGRLEAIEADVKEIYNMISHLRQEYVEEIKRNKRIEKRLDQLEGFARLVSQQTGIPLPKQ